MNNKSNQKRKARKEKKRKEKWVVGCESQRAEKARAQN